MAQSVLGSVGLGYQLLWDQLRQLAAIQLFISPDPDSPIDAVHLLGTFKEMWPEQAPQLLLSVQSLPLLRDILVHGPTDAAWIEVPQAWLADPAVAQQVHQAQQRGMTLVWRGDPGERPSAALARCFARTMVALTPEEALTGLRISLKKHHGNDTGPNSALKSPVVPGQIYEAVASRVLAEHCLDQQGAWAVAGWPMEDVLHGYRHQLIQPSHHAIVKLAEACDADASMEAIEHILGEEPILAYRFLRFANSAALGLRTEIESLRQGLMVLGYAQLKAWLLEQLPHASSELNLQPIRSAMVMRARLMEHLLDAGEGDDLRREIYLCGLLSQIDMLLGEPLSAALQRLPLSERTISALLSHSGPYVPYLDLAAALETPATQATRQKCMEHEMSSEDVNRALLHTLTAVQARPAKGSLLV